MELMTSFTKPLPAALSEEEKHTRASQLARILEEIADVEIEKSKVSRQFAERLKGLKRTSMDLARAVSRGEEDRPVLCSERADFRRFAIETYRHDTGGVVESRAMTTDEVEEARQTNLFGGGGGVRVATEKRLDVDSPGAAEEEQTNGASTLADAVENIRNPGEGTKVSHGFGDDIHPVAEISDPAAVLAGDVPPAEGSGRVVRRRRKGLKLTEASPEPTTATEIAKELGVGAPAPEVEPPPASGVEAGPSWEVAAVADVDEGDDDFEDDDETDGDEDDGEEP